MITVTLAPTGGRAHAAQAALARLVDALGSEDFGPALAAYLHGLCGADHFAAFDLRAGDLRELAACCVQPERTARDRVASYVGGWWRRDPAMDEAQRRLGDHGTSIIHVDVQHGDYSDIRPSVYPQVSDRLLVCGRTSGSCFGLSVLRQLPRERFATEAVHSLAAEAGLLVALLAKHARLRRQHVPAADALRRLPDIEHCIAACGGLPQREAQVCARILYGLSSTGIALDLQVSEETVKTYRKRAYRRLAIGSERELLGWYLARWSCLHSS